MAATLAARAARLISSCGGRDLIIFVEVKARSDEMAALTAVTPAKARLIASAARRWLCPQRLGARPQPSRRHCRDHGWRKPAHVEEAFGL